MRATSRGIGRRHVWAVAGIVVATAAVLLVMGRVPICTCGYVKPWHGIVVSAENSQHLSLGLRLVLAVALEATWEIVENLLDILQLVYPTDVVLEWQRG